MAGADRISFLGVSCPAHLRLQTLTLQAGDSVDYQRADWVEALVVVERGELEIECRSGVRARFAEGAVLTFVGLELRRLYNPGSVPLVVSALSRSRPHV